MAAQLVKQGVSIVVRGNFTPTIFHPAWFATQNLVRKEEADAATVEIVHRAASSFTMEWLSVNVTPERFQASTTDEGFYEATRDLMIGTFELLDHTPVTALGVNREFRYQLESEKSWHLLGDTLAPKDGWMKEISQPGLRSLVIQGKRRDDFDGRFLVKVEPWSSQHIPYGVYVEVNDHYDLSPSAGTSAANILTDILATNWQQSMRYEYIIC